MGSDRTSSGGGLAGFSRAYAAAMSDGLVTPGLDSQLVEDPVEQDSCRPLPARADRGALLHLVCVASDPQIRRGGWREATCPGGHAGGLAVDVERCAPALLEDAGHMGPLAQCQPRRAHDAERVAAGGDVEAELPAVAHTEEPTTRLASLLQERGVVEGIRAKCDPALHGERTCQPRHLRCGDQNVGRDAVKLQRLPRHTGHEPAVALKMGIERLEVQVERRRRSGGDCGGRRRLRKHGCDEEPDKGRAAQKSHHRSSNQ